MRIKIDCEKVLGNYEVQIRLEEAESAEFKEAVAKNGIPTCEIGGTFYKTVEVKTVDPETDEEIVEEKEVEAFKLVSKVIKLTEDLPYTRVFKTTQYGENTKENALIFSKEVKKRLDTELDKLRVTDDFSDKDLDVIF